MFEFLKFSKTKPAQPQPVVLSNPAAEIPTNQNLQSVPALIVPGFVMLKTKKWVRVGNETGIVTKFDSSGYATIDLVNERGETKSTTRVPAGQIRLAKYMEIPEPRRGDPVKAATLGYV